MYDILVSKMARRFDYMNPKSEAQAKPSAKQAHLVQNKMEVLQKARGLQADLARVRVDLARIDQEMLKAGFHLPALACW
jgi:hypothetical protein